MGLTNLPTQAPGSLGSPKTQRRPTTDLPGQATAEEYNNLTRALVDACAAIGLADGTTPGSLVAQINALNATIDAGYNIDAYGGVADGVTDNIDALEEILEAIGDAGIYGNRISFGAGNYYFSRSPRFEHAVALEGVYSGSGDRAATRWTFATGSNGPIFEGVSTSRNGGTSQFSTMRGIACYSNGNGSRMPIGIVIRARVFIFQPFIQGFADSITNTQGDYSWATSYDAREGDLAANGGNTYVCQSSGTTAAIGSGPSGTGSGIVDGGAVWDYVDTTNVVANHVEIHSPRCQNQTRYAIYFKGSDQNTGYITHPEIVGGTIGLLDESFLGNWWVKGAIADTSVHPYANNKSGANFNQIGCIWDHLYTESGQPGAYISAPAAHYEGLEAAGWVTTNETTKPVQRLRTTANVDVQIGATHHQNDPHVASGYSGFDFFRSGSLQGSDGGIFWSLYPNDSAGVPFHLRHTGAWLAHYISMNYASTAGLDAWGFASATGENGNRAVPPGMFAFNNSYGFYIGGTRVMYLDAVPSATDGPFTDGKWWDFYTDDIIFIRGRVLGEAEGVRCSAPGTDGTYSEGRTATTNGTTTVVLNLATSVLSKGNYVTINATTVRIVSVAANGLSFVASATIAAAAAQAIVYAAPTFRDLANSIADETTLTKSGATFSVKNGGVGGTQIAAAIKSAAQATDSLRQIDTATPQPHGTAAAGNETKAAASNHVHSNVFKRKVRVDATATPTLAVTDEILRLSSGSAITVSLPAAADGLYFRLKKSGTGTNTVSLDPAGSENIYFLGTTAGAGTTRVLDDSNSTLQPEWDVWSEGGDWYVG